MDTGCSALVSDLDDLKLTQKNPRDDHDDESNDSHDGFDGEELLAVAEEGLGPDVLKLALKNARDDDDDDNDSNSDSDDGWDGAELLAAAEEGLGQDVLLPILVKNPGLIRTGDAVGNTVLHMAAREGDIGTVCKLIAFLEERQDENLKKVFMDGNIDGDTALHLALKNRHREVAYCLIKAEKRTRDVCNNDWKYPYHLAYEAGFSEENQLTCFLPELHMRIGRVDAEMQVRKEDLIVTNRSVAVRWIDLYQAINKGDVDALITGLTRGGKELLQHQDSRGETLLHASVKASGRGHLQKLVRFMISNCATDAACLADKNGDTALHLAVQFEDLNASNCLIKAEPKTVYQVNHKGVSPLYMAVKAGNHELVKCMLSYCCLRDRASEILSHPKHATLAHLAIKAKSFRILKLLMEHLPQLIKVRDEKGWRPLSYAANKGSLDEVTYFLTNFPKFAEKSDNDGSFPIHKAVGGGHVSIVEAFLKHCPQSLHHVERKGRTILHIAVCYGRDDILTYLENEVKLDDSFLNQRDNGGQTFMDYAKGPQQ